MDDLDSFELSAIFNCIQNSVFIKNEKLQFIFVNKAYEKMFNRKKQYILGKTVLELDYLSEPEKMFYQNEDMEMVQTGKTRHHIFQYAYKGKEMHTCLYWSSGFVQKNGKRGLVGVIVDINKQSKKIYNLNKQLHIISSERREVVKKHMFDALTHVYTRGVFAESLQKFASPTGRFFSCIMLDIDHFKQVNDTFGHAAGDSVLKELGAILKKCCRNRDMACRYGGEEFVVLLPGSKREQAVMVAERIRRIVSKQLHVPDGRCVTISAGCSEYIPGEPGAFVVERADKALYTAKQSGRNRVCVG